jgi:hypothetical protein
MKLWVGKNVYGIGDDLIEDNLKGMNKALKNLSINSKL